MAERKWPVYHAVAMAAIQIVDVHQYACNFVFSVCISFFPSIVFLQLLHCTY
jgi:hypothetical protein